MENSRRNFIRNSSLGMGFLGTGLMAAGSCVSDPDSKDPDLAERYRVLDEELAGPVLDPDAVSDPLIIRDLELLRFGDSFLCRVRSTDGHEGISVSNNAQMRSLYPVFTNRLQPYFPGKDAAKIEDLIEGVYVYRSNYKLQGLALWIPLATIEFAILDMIGQAREKSIGDLFGRIHNPSIAVYRANNYRGKSATESIRLIRDNVEETRARALKFKVGGRMSRNADDPPGRTEELIPMIRREFGEEMVVYADSNGSYDVDEALRIGRLMEEHSFDFYEEPVPFDWYEGTLEVSRALSIPVAGGEQEPSLRNFRWLLANDALDIAQPDVFYFGGMIRSMRVAKMAHRLGKTCVPHISGSGLGYLYMMQFVSALPNAGPYHEFKGFSKDIPFECSSSDLSSKNGTIKVPTGPGLGIELDPGFVSKHERVI